jgi:hypothetical protein
MESPTRPRRRPRWLRLSPLGRDLSVVLAVKLAALALLWWAFFSHPMPHPPGAGSVGVAAHLLPSPSPEEPPHADR